MWNNSNVIVLCFNAYSCGKFLSNILSYNSNFIPQYPFGFGQTPLQTVNLDYTQLSFDELLLLKHDTIMRSLPPKKDIKNWVYYELGCEQFWGTWAEAMPLTPICAKAEWVLQQGKYCFIMAHNSAQADVLLNNFPSATVIKIINDRRVNLLSKKIKTRDRLIYVDLLKNFVPKNCLEFDIDLIFDKDVFFKNINRLLTDIGVQDRSLDSRVFEYYQKYCEYYKEFV